MTHEALNDLLLRLGISTTGLAFGMSVPIFLRILKQSNNRYANRIAYVVVGLIVVSTIGLIVFKDHVTARRLFLLLATASASFTLYCAKDFCREEDK